MSFNVDTPVVITDGNYQYFRPSMIKMKKEIKSEIKDYKDEKIKTNIIDSINDLTMVDHPFDRLCFVRNRIKEMGISSKNKNSVEIMVLLGLEHKLMTQENQVDEFIGYYQTLINELCQKSNKCKYSIFRIFKLHNLIEKHLFPLIQDKSKHERKLEKFQQEKKEIVNLLQYIRGKILFLADENISKLGLVKD